MKEIKLTKKQIDEIMSLDFSNPDIVVSFLLDFYAKHNIGMKLDKKTEKKLLAELTKYKPLKTAMKIQKQM